MAADDQLAAIVEVGRRTREATPRWQWIAAAIVGAVCAAGFAIAALSAPAPVEPRADRRPVESAGLGTGLAIGAALGLVIGVAIGRQRRDHSSRSSP